MNIAQLNSRGKRVRLLCFEPKGHLPIGDVLLAQKMALELFESETMRIANHSSPDFAHAEWHEMRSRPFRYG